MNFKIIFLTIFVLSNSFPQSHIPSGRVSGIWLKEKSPYYIDGEIRINYGDKLIIEPSVKVIFTGHYKLLVNGLIEAIGTEHDSILFTAQDTAQGWHGVRFIESSNTSILSYCILEYGLATTNIDSLKLTAMLKDTPIWYDEFNNDIWDLNGGAIFMYKSNPLIQDCIIRYNTAECNGGGIAIFNGSNPIINNCRIYGNTARQFDGGGISCWNYSNPTIKKCGLYNNRVPSASGGGIDIENNCQPLIEKCVIEYNYALNAGGFRICSNSEGTINNCIVRYNSAIIAGGISVSKSKPTLRELLIEKNKAKEYCGGMDLADTDALLERLTIKYNSAKIGGGVQIEGYPRPVFSEENRCNIYLNYAIETANDIYTTSFDTPKDVLLDTFTVNQYNELLIYPIDLFNLKAENYKLTKVRNNLYVSPKGNDANTGKSKEDPLRTLNIALTKILANSVNPGTIYLDEGLYTSELTNDILKLGKLKFVSIKGIGLSNVSISAESIIVFTPWWSTNFAIISFVILGILLIVVVWQLQLRRIRVRNEFERQKFEAKKLQEIDDMKTRFFTNISHEFRTPLTLIQGPAKLIIENSDNQSITDSADIIHRSAGKLNKLVNQLLDLTKLEAGEMKLKTTQINVVELLKEMLLSFAPLMEKKKQNLKFDNVGDQILIYLDTDKFDKIITNILSNAIKFTAERGKVTVKVAQKEKKVEIQISDTGIGISKDRLPKVFDRFYQVDGNHTREQEGTGIGLALTKELIELHKGEIEVKSEEGEGTTFTVRFLLGKEHLTSDEIIDKEEIEERSPAFQGEDVFEGKATIDDTDFEKVTQEERSSLLIVEDNSDVRKFVKGVLENDYLIYEATNGKEGLKKSMEIMPDLIISDVMMPQMDGLELCTKIKTDKRISHIPVILLTAKATDKDKIIGYETGADDYVMKPFDADVLKVRVKNLMDQRNRLREHFKKEGLFNVDIKDFTPVDKLFLKKASEVINKYLSDTSFGVEMFAHDLGVSRTLLYKKIVALVGLAPSELIKMTRLSKAAKLLENNTGNISEIALEVGFNTPAYFSDCFHKQFGESPLKYQQKFQQKQVF